jgi:phosphoglycolate phosphatase
LTAAAIFDIDGTLVTFTFDVVHSREALLREMSTRGFRTDALGLSTPTQVIIDAAYDQIRRGLVGADFEELRRRFYEILDGFELAGVSTTSILPGVSASLAHLRSQGVRLAVLTNSGRKSASIALDRAGLAGVFEFVLTRDETRSLKPRPEGLKMAVQMLGVPVRDVYYVGDSTMDIAAARAAGLKVISVATGSYSADRLRSEGADYVVTSMLELPHLIGVEQGRGQNQ